MSSAIFDGECPSVSASSKCGGGARGWRLLLAQHEIARGPGMRNDSRPGGMPVAACAAQKWRERNLDAEKREISHLECGPCGERGRHVRGNARHAIFGASKLR